MSDDPLPEPDTEWHGDPAWTGDRWQVAWNGPDRVTVIVGEVGSRARRSMGLSNAEACRMADALYAASVSERPEVDE